MAVTKELQPRSDVKNVELLSGHSWLGKAKPGHSYIFRERTTVGWKLISSRPTAGSSGRGPLAFKSLKRIRATGSASALGNQA